MSEREMGEHAVAIQQLQTDMRGVKDDVREIRDFVIDVRARWRTIVTVAVGVGAFAGAILAFFADVAKAVIERRVAP